MNIIKKILSIKYLQNKYRKMINRSSTIIKLTLSWKCRDGFNLRKSSNVINHINRVKYKDCIFFLIGTEKTFGKIQHVFMIKILEKV